ncbi:co-chaperone DjlA [Marinospirillum sp. MEB164]|uniref:Co-chaperone DjlA n=1 Tax=Marinospirillum alkalitolerans TaxID=3123374 RepID=A0ABW8PWY6_9GAMM
MKWRWPHFAGKAGGACIGFLLGGWIGFALGIILGHSFDYHREHLWARLPRLRFGSPFKIAQPAEQVYRHALFVCLGHIAKQDGRVSPQEIAAAEGIFKQLKLKPKARQEAIQLFNEGKMPNSQIEGRLTLFSQRYRSNKAKRLELLDHLLTISYAKGGPHPAQIARLKALLPILQLSLVELERLQRRRDQQQQRQQHKQYNRQGQATQEKAGLLAAYHELGLNSTASDEEIKLAYRRLMSQHHPDKLVAQGLTDRALEKATEKTQDIQQAYALLKKVRQL